VRWRGARRAVEQQDSGAGEIYAISAVKGLKASLGPDCFVNCSIRPTRQTMSKESICEYGSKEQIDNEYVQRRAVHLEFTLAQKKLKRRSRAQTALCNFCVIAKMVDLQKVASSKQNMK
jgi:hypothetical protein